MYICHVEGLNCLSDERETLDELGEIIVKYSTSSHINLVGDLNASVHRDEPFVRD